jgi:hypothetical protein
LAFKHDSPTGAGEPEALEPLATLSPPRARPLVGMAMALDGAQPSSPDEIVMFTREPPLGTEKLLLFRKMLLGGAAVTDTDLSADIIPSRTGLSAHNPLALEHRPERLSDRGEPIESPRTSPRSPHRERRSL